MTMMTLGLGEASSRPARRYVAVPARVRPHVWAEDDRCERRAMRRTWDGARVACTGIDGLGLAARGRARR